MVKNTAEYNKNYYNANKDKIAKYYAEKKECEVCGKSVARISYDRHKKTKLCSKRAENQSAIVKNTDLEKLKEFVKELNDKDSINKLAEIIKLIS